MRNQNKRGVCKVQAAMDGPNLSCGQEDKVPGMSWRETGSRRRASVSIGICPSHFHPGMALQE